MLTNNSNLRLAIFFPFYFKITGKTKEGFPCLWWLEYSSITFEEMLWFKRSQKTLQELLKGHMNLLHPLEKKASSLIPFHRLESKEEGGLGVAQPR